MSETRTSDAQLAEQAFLESLSTVYAQHESPQTQIMRELALRAFRPYLHRPASALELGCSDGLMTASLAAETESLDVVDASQGCIEQARARGIANARFFCSLFETFEPQARYDAVFASWILEHVLDPTDVYALARRALRPGGLMFALVPNSRALSRQLAVHMGLLPSVRHLTPNDHRYGHRRTYDRQSFNAELEAAGFEIVGQGGIMLKILADFQLDKLFADGFLGPEHVDGLYRLGEEYPDLCGSIFAVCRLRANGTARQKARD